MGRKRTIQFAMDLAAILLAVLGVAEIIPRGIGFAAAICLLAAVLFWNGVDAMREKRKAYAVTMMLLGAVMAGFAVTVYLFPLF